MTQSRPPVLLPAPGPLQQADLTGLTPGHPYPWEEDFDLLGDKVKEVTDQLLPDLRGCNIWLVSRRGRRLLWRRRLCGGAGREGKTRWEVVAQQQQQQCRVLPCCCCAAVLPGRWVG